MTAYRDIVLRHFRQPHNRGSLPEANAEAEGANPLCGDRVRICLKIDDGFVSDAQFTANACILCIASASVLTDEVKGLSLTEAADLKESSIHGALQGEPPPGRLRCVLLPLETLHRALSGSRES